jgi:hypothetical protein
MTLAQLERRVKQLEQQVGDLRLALDYRQAVDGIRRGLESADRGEGEPVKKAFADIRRNGKQQQPQQRRRAG